MKPKKHHDAADYLSKNSDFNLTESTRQIDSTRKDALSILKKQRFGVEHIQTADLDILTTLQTLSRHGSTLGIWETPYEWTRMRSPAERCINLRARIIASLPHHLQHEIGDAGPILASQSTPWPHLESVASTRVVGIVKVLEAAVVCFTRYLLICRLGPAGMAFKARLRPLDPSSIVEMANSWLPPLIARGVVAEIATIGAHSSPQASANLCFFYHVTRDDLLHFSESQRIRASNELNRLQMLSQFGIWSDIPKFLQRHGLETDPAGPVKTTDYEPERDPHLPLPDEYVGEMGWKSLWITYNLGHNILRMRHDIENIWRSCVVPDEKIEGRLVAKHRAYRLRRYLLGFQWTDSDGSVFSNPPFDIRLTNWGNKSSNDDENEVEAVTHDEFDNSDISGALLAWPPSNFSQLTGIWALVQRAHLFLVGLSTTQRKSELLTLERDCVRNSSDGTVNIVGRTYKLVDWFEGREKIWELPRAAAYALAQQRELVEMAQSIGYQNPDVQMAVASKRLDISPERILWARISVGKQFAPHLPLQGLNKTLLGYARDLGMSAAPGDQLFRSHRFRKTIARLAALALNDSVKLLADIFGHTDVSMTLSYILTDKELASEIKVVQNELRVMRASEAVSVMVQAEDCEAEAANEAATRTLDHNEGYGGGGAKRLKSEIKALLPRKHRLARDWGVDTVSALAMRFVASGMAFDYVGNGVLCIKSFTQRGACSYKIGKRDTSKCTVTCDFHLLEPQMRTEVNQRIADCLAFYETADDWMREVWAEKLLSHLEAYADIREKWLIHPTINRIAQEHSARLT